MVGINTILNLFECNRWEPYKRQVEYTTYCVAKTSTSNELDISCDRTTVVGWTSETFDNPKHSREYNTGPISLLYKFKIKIKNKYFLTFEETQVIFLL